MKLPRPVPLKSENVPSGASVSRQRAKPQLIVVEELHRNTLTSVLKRESRAGVPAVMVSLGMHILVLLACASMIFSRQTKKTFDPLALGWSAVPSTEAGSGGGTPGVEIASVRMDALPNAVSTTEVPEKVTPPETAVSDAGTTGSPSVQVVDVSNALESRGASRGTGGKGNGGQGTGSGAGNGDGTGGGGTGVGGPVGNNQELRKAIDRSLQWFSRQQKDGHWKLTGPYSEAGERSVETDTGATALSLLVLLGDGHTHKSGDYKETVGQALAWLKRTQRSNGDLFDLLEQGKEAHFYSHAQATMALCEALALTHDESLRPVANKAVDFLIKAQNPVKGGWKYRPLDEKGIGDLSVTGWALMALHSARMAKIDVSIETFELAGRFLNQVEVNGDASQFKYRPDLPQNPDEAHSMTAEGLLCRQWLGWPKNHPPMKKGVEFLLGERNRPVWEKDRRNVYAWYYTGQTLHNLGGDEWVQWFGETQELIIKHQDRAGKQTGSWHPHNPRGAFLEWSHAAGRLYFSAVCTLILETPNRHAPLY